MVSTKWSLRRQDWGMGEHWRWSHTFIRILFNLNLEKTSFHLIWIDACLSFIIFSFCFHIQFHYQISMLGQITSTGERLGKWVQLSVVDLIFRSLLTKGLLVLPFLSKTRHDSQNQGHNHYYSSISFSPLFFFIWYFIPNMCPYYLKDLGLLVVSIIN